MTESIPSRNPRQAAELDAFLGQRLGFLLAGLAVDAALVALAVVDLARLLGEFVADRLAVLLDLLAHLEQRLAQFLRHMPGKSRHLLLFWRRSRRRHGGGRCLDVRLAVPVAALAEAALAEALRHA